MGHSGQLRFHIFYVKVQQKHHFQFFKMIKMMFSFPKPNQEASRSHIDLFHAGMGILTSAFMASEEPGILEQTHSYMFTFTTEAILGRCRNRL